MATIAMKFGGTSVADLERIRHVASLVKREVERATRWRWWSPPWRARPTSWSPGPTRPPSCHRPTAMPQAVPDQREYDVVVAAGEQVTAGLLAMTLNAMGVKARSWMGWQVPIETSAVHGSARIEAVPAIGDVGQPGRGRSRRGGRLPGRGAGQPHLHPGPRRLGHLRGGGGRRHQGRRVATSIPTSTGSTPPIRASCAKARRLEKIAYRGNAGNGIAGRQGAADPFGRDRHAAPGADPGAFDFRARTGRHIALRRGRYRGKETGHRHRL